MFGPAAEREEKYAPKDPQRHRFNAYNYTKGQKEKKRKEKKRKEKKRKENTQLDTAFGYRQNVPSLND
jgi:hypothetical protein